MSYTSIGPCTMLSPVPAVMVSCRRAPEERPDIITVAWAGTVNSEPPMVSVSVRKSRFSHDIILESGEFVVNMVDAAHARELDWCGVKSGRDVDKFAELGLQAIPAEGMTLAPAIDGMPGYLSCKVRQVLELGSHDMFLGEVTAVCMRDDLFAADGSLHLERSGLVCYAHGTYQKAEEPLGFFGWSVARPEVLRKRMAALRQDERKR